MTVPVDFHLLFESGLNPSLVLTPDFRIAAANDAYLEVSQKDREALIGKDVFQLDLFQLEQGGSDDLRASFQKVLRTKQPDTVALAAVSAVNSPVIGKGGEVAYIVHCLDRQAAEAKVQLEAANQVLSGLYQGIAHDFNNELTVIMGCSELILAKLSSENPLYPRFQQILHAGQRAEATTRSLLALSQEQAAPASTREQPVGERESSPSATTSNSTSSNATILVVEDSDSLRSLLQEILTFAGHKVIPAADGEEAVRISRENPGAIDLLIADVVLPKMSGPKIAEAIAATRPETKVLFISGHPGDFAGLPESTANFLQKPFTPAVLRTTIQQILETPKPRQSQRILVIDDEQPICELVASILEPLGFEVHTASSGAEARRTLKVHPVDLVITDLAMPGEEGIEIIRYLRKSFPAIKIVAMSGAFGQEVLDAAMHLGALAALTKPLSSEKVRLCVEGLSGR